LHFSYPRVKRNLETRPSGFEPETFGSVDRGRIGHRSRCRGKCTALRCNARCNEFVVALSFHGAAPALRTESGRQRPVIAWFEEQSRGLGVSSRTSGGSIGWRLQGRRS
jgi:hypothetical protein